MSRYCLIDPEKYRPGGTGTPGFSKLFFTRWNVNDLNIYTELCARYVDDLIEQYNPDAFLIVTGSELDIKTIYGDVIEHIGKRLAGPNKWTGEVHVFSPGWPTVLQDDHIAYPKPGWVTHHIYQGYDQVLFQHNLYWLRHNSLPHFEDHIYPDWYKKISPDLLYTCYNNQPRDYRHYTIDQLYKHDLLDKGIVTAKYSTVDQVAEPDYIISDSWPFEHLPIGTTLVDESDFHLNTTKEFGCQEFPKSYGRGAIDIVTESRVNPGELYLSEKTNKSLLGHKPFIVVGAPGYHKWLQEERDIELYTEIFDYSFDDEPNWIHRVDGIIDNIKRLSEEYTTPEDYQRLYDSVKEKAERNFFRHMNVMISGIHSQPLNNFLGLDPVNNSIEDFNADKIQDYVHNLQTGDDIDRQFQFYYEYVMPQFKGTYDWMKEIKDITDLII